MNSPFQSAPWIRRQRYRLDERLSSILGRLFDKSI